MKLYALFILPFLFATSVQAAEPQTIGYVNMQAVFDQSKLGQEAQQILKEKFEGRQQELAREQQSIQQLQDTLDRDKPLMSQEELDKQTTVLESRKKKFQQRLKQSQKELTQEENKLANRILEPAPAIIEAVAKGKKVSIVFDHRKNGLLYIDAGLNLTEKGLDLTAEVIKRLDAQPGARKKDARK